MLLYRDVYTFSVQPVSVNRLSLNTLYLFLMSVPKKSLLTYDVFPVDKFCVAHIYNRIFAGNVLSVNGDVLPDIQAVVILFSLAVLHVDFKLEVSVPTAITLEKYTCGVHMDGAYGLGNVHFR